MGTEHEGTRIMEVVRRAVGVDEAQAREFFDREASNNFGKAVREPKKIAEEAGRNFAKFLSESRQEMTQEPHVDSYDSWKPAR